MRELIGVVETKDGSTPIVMNVDCIVFIERWKDRITGKMEEWNYAIFYNQYNIPMRVRLDLPNSIPFPKILDNSKNDTEVWINLDFVKSYRRFIQKHEDKFIIEMDIRFVSQDNDPLKFNLKTTENNTKARKSMYFIVRELPSGLALP